MLAPIGRNRRSLMVAERNWFWYQVGMKSLLSITVAVFVFAPVVFAGDSKTCDQAKAACDKAQASECTSAKKSCPKEAAALRVTLLTHKGALLAKR